MRISIWPLKGPSGAVLERPANDALRPVESLCTRKSTGNSAKSLRAAASRLKLGDGLQKETDVGPVINESQFKKILKYIEIGKKEGAKLILGGKACQKGNCSKGYFIEPTLFSDVTPEMRIAQEEIFGPVVSVIKAEDLEDAIRIVNRTPYGLSSADLYSGCECIGHRREGSGDRNCLHQCLHHWRGDTTALWRDQTFGLWKEGGRRSRGRVWTPTVDGR